MTAYVQIEQVNAYCPDCSWGQGPYTDGRQAQQAVDQHNLEEHARSNDSMFRPSHPDPWVQDQENVARAWAYHHAGNHIFSNMYDYDEMRKIYDHLKSLARYFEQQATTKGA